MVNPSKFGPISLFFSISGICEQLLLCLEEVGQVQFEKKKKKRYSNLNKLVGSGQAKKNLSESWRLYLK